MATLKLTKVYKMTNIKKNSRKKILIIKSGCAYNKECEYNKGSLAVIITATKTIRDYIPDAEITTFIQLSKKLEKKLGIKVIRKGKINTIRDYSIINSLNIRKNKSSEYSSNHLLFI